MEISGGGMLSRLSEKIVGWIALGLLIFLGIAVYQMPSETKAAIWSGIWRTLVWLMLAAGTPWVSALFIRRVRDAGSNWAGIALVAGLSLVNIVVGLMLMTAWPSSGWGWAGIVAALGVAGTYNFLVAEYLAETAG